MHQDEHLGNSSTPPQSRSRKPAKPSLAPIVEALGPPISHVAWSPELVAQTLEILPVSFQGGQLVWLKPVHAESLRVGLPRTAKPGDVVLSVLGWYPLHPWVVHSTSWRYEEGQVILTYVVVIEPPEQLPADSLDMVPVRRVEIARGEAMSPPQTIGVTHVLEHALRHLAWLVRTDRAIAAALTAWGTVLDGYQPEPFQSLGG